MPLAFGRRIGWLLDIGGLVAGLCSAKHHLSLRRARKVGRRARTSTLQMSSWEDAGMA
jgi:hypothetical protein